MPLLLPLLPSFPEVYLVGVPRAPMALACPPQEAADVSAHLDEVVQELAYLLVPLALGHLLVQLDLLVPAYVPSALVVREGV